jgi:hypothetical protein
MTTKTKDDPTKGLEASTEELIKNADIKLAGLRKQHKALQSQIATYADKKEALTRKLASEKEALTQQQAAYSELEHDLSLARATSSLTTGTQAEDSTKRRVSVLESELEQAKIALDLATTNYANAEAMTNAEIFSLEEAEESDREDMASAEASYNDTEEVRAALFTRLGIERHDALVVELGVLQVQLEQAQENATEKLIETREKQASISSVLKEWPELAKELVGTYGLPEIRKMQEHKMSDENTKAIVLFLAFIDHIYTKGLHLDRDMLARLTIDRFSIQMFAASTGMGATVRRDMNYGQFEMLDPDREYRAFVESLKSLLGEMETKAYQGKEASRLGMWAEFTAR